MLWCVCIRFSEIKCNGVLFYWFAAWFSQKEDKRIKKELGFQEKASKDFE